MTNPAEQFEQRIADHDDRLRYEPKDEREQLVRPDLTLFRETVNSTDRALADGFFRHYRHLFINGDGNLYVYHGDRGAWSRDKVPDQVLAYCMHLSDRYYDELAEVVAGINELRGRGAVNDQEMENLTRRRDAIQRMIVHCEKAATIGNVARMLTAKLSALMADQPVKMNSDPTVIACANGVVELKTGTLRWPKAIDYITKNTGVVYKEDADTGWWEQIVKQICGDNPRMAEFLQVWCGYCLTGYTKEHCMAIFWGMGRNGKNLLIDSLAAAMGNYAQSLPSSFMESTGIRDTMDNNMLFALAQLDGVRMAYISETGERGKLRESWVKSQTGDRIVRARLARENFYEFQLTHKFTVGTNHKPEITGTDDGVWERVRMVPFRIRFGTEEEIASGIAQQLADRDLLNRTTSTAGREAVLKWAVAGARKYLEHGLRRYTPPEIHAETLGYRREQDVMGQFLTTATEYIHPNDVDKIKAIEVQGNRQFQALSTEDRLRIEKRELWQTYCVWCEENGHKPMSATTFAKRITVAQRFWQDDIGDERLMPALDSVKVGASWCYRYIRLSEEGYRMRAVARAQRERMDRVRDEDAD